MNQLTARDGGIPTLEQVWKDYRRFRKLQPSTALHYDYLLQRYVKDWLVQPISSITKQHCIERHERLSQRNGKSLANYVLTVISSLLNFAIDFYDDKIQSKSFQRLKHGTQKNQTLRTSFPQQNSYNGFQPLKQLKVKP